VQRSSELDDGYDSVDYYAFDNIHIYLIPMWLWP